MLRLKWPRAALTSLPDARTAIKRHAQMCAAPSPDLSFLRIALWPLPWRMPTGNSRAGDGAQWYRRRLIRWNWQRLHATHCLTNRRHFQSDWIARKAGDLSRKTPLGLNMFTRIKTFLKQQSLALRWRKARKDSCWVCEWRSAGASVPQGGKFTVEAAHIIGAKQIAKRLLRDSVAPSGDCKWLVRKPTWIERIQSFFAD